MNPDMTAPWIGRKCRYWEKRSRSVAVQTEYTLVGVAGAGAHKILFEAVGSDGKFVVGFPCNHVGFLIGLPPNRFFPELQGNERYQEQLVLRVSALQGSTAVSTVFPLDGLWNSLAVQHLPGCDQEWLKATDYGELLNCDLVAQKLTDWSTCNLGREEDELLVIHDYERPIHADPACVLAEEAREALRAIQTPSCTLQTNPLLLWIVVGISGYDLPAAAASTAVVALRGMADAESAIRQAHLVLRYAGRHGDWGERMTLLKFMNSVDNTLHGRSDVATDVLLKLFGRLLG